MSDVRSTRLASTGTVTAGRGRIVGLHIVCGASAGSVTLRDGGGSGTTVLVIDSVASATESHSVLIPGDGILCGTDIHATLSNVTAVTVFFA